MQEQTIACLLVSRLPVKAERQRYPSLRDKAVIIVDRRRYDGAVLESSPEAQGVTAGMPLAKALICCPEAVVLAADREYYDDVFGRMAEALATRYPVVEKGERGCLYAGLEGLSPVYGGEARLIASLLQAAPARFDPQVGVASTRFLAYAVASSALPGRGARAPRDSAAFLSGLSVELLPVSSECKLGLERSGVATLGMLASLPVSAVGARLGAEGHRAWELARGVDHSPIQEFSRAAA